MPVEPIFAIVLLSAYFLPTIHAAMSKHSMLIPIAIVNLAFGWTFFGWVVALAWAFSGQKRA